jgi:hypothetical protein
MTHEKYEDGVYSFVDWIAEQLGQTLRETYQWIISNRNSNWRLQQWWLNKRCDGNITRDVFSHDGLARNQMATGILVF